MIAGWNYQGAGENSQSSEISGGLWLIHLRLAPLIKGNACPFIGFWVNAPKKDNL